MSPMNPPSTRSRTGRAPRRPLADPHHAPSLLRRRSSRIQSRQRSLAIPPVQESSYVSQSSSEQRPTGPQILQPFVATSYTRVPTSGPVEVSPPVSSRAQLQEYIRPPQTHNCQRRSRRLDRYVEIGAETPPKRARLTEKNLKVFEKMGRQQRTDTNPSRSETKSKSKSSTTTGSTNKTVPTTDSSFPRLAFENGILDPDHSVPHENLSSHQDRLDSPRNSISPSESVYREFAHRIRRAPNEQTMVFETSTLLKRHERGYGRVYNQAFNDFPKNVGFNNGLSATQPDMVEGLEMTEFDPFPVRQELGGAAVPTSERDPLTLPHLAGEWKGPGKNMILAETQAAYDGACMVHGRNAALSFLKTPDPAGFAHVHTFTTDGTTLNTFAHYSSDTQGQVKYHQHPTSSSFLLSSYDDFKKSRQRLRNLQDNAKETSEKLRDDLNEKWSTNNQSPLSPNVPTDSTDNNSYDYDDEEDPNHKLLAGY
ncbi:uncharacterized protein BP5553_04859 [Venustampulla echinocandica]|uniref:DUF7924 domain-containing protein n=1 Tax=Venustampulla echinocandica TaxID=2656787 RepID=A0A370TPH8_9HELO|nr:uncharacterized protein BP5553_04859 [Venustampulla echinocandica]RDL37426.1 hypothetical protein BP5553_04859 [Venustampulla echinocandica]